ncbi:hypothetical protein F2Q69_00003035 [Brassica cretica]|uniref:Uncharacterized protein n=1 Tax=Brassica cretica TaxID=69181 RepID=A0A8S9PGR6_BRACR|nr:hypothetical protein F2Q69_00003035 [Brassica cretica]
MASENSEAPAIVAETVPVNHVTKTATMIQRRTEVAEAVNDSKTDNEVAVIALGSTDDMGNPDKVDTEGIKDSWLEVSPSKIGRSPMRSPTRKQLEEPFISASKFYVLSTEEEDEEGETNDATSGNAIERNATGEEEDISVVEELTENKPVEDDSQRSRQSGPGRGQEVNDSWSDVHLSKLGRSSLRSPVRKQFEEPIISASKFYVLCSDEEEEDGEIKNAISVNEVEEDIIGDEENTIGGEEDTHEVEELTVINLRG